MTENMLHRRPSYTQDSSGRSAASLLVVEGGINHFVTKNAYGIRQAQSAHSASGGGFDGCGRLRRTVGSDRGMVTGRGRKNVSGGSVRHLITLSVNPMQE